MTSDEARMFAARHHRVEVAEVLSNPFGRPLGWAVLLGGLAFTPLLTPLIALVLPAAVAVVVAYLLGAVILCGIWHAMAPLMEARGFRSAAHRWLVDFGGGAGAGAYADRDRSGRLTLYSVWADPRGRGHGTELLTKVIADTAPEELWLTADNRRVADFYRRLGFVGVGRRLLGHHMVLRRPRIDQETAAP